MYASETLALAALEAVAHMDPDDAPEDFVAIPVEIPDGISVREIEVRELPANWRSYPAPAALQDIGTDWARGMESAVLSVPSVLVPRERNFLLNPRHPDFGRLRIASPEPFGFDPRLLR